MLHCFSDCGNSILDRSVDVSHLYLERHNRNRLIATANHILLRLPERGLLVRQSALGDQRIVALLDSGLRSHSQHTEGTLLPRSEPLERDRIP
jgi:hypothetical protein